MSTPHKAEQYLAAAKTVVSTASYITTFLCVFTAGTGISTSLIGSQILKYEPANYLLPVSIILPLMVGGWFYSSVIGPANAVLASGDAIKEYVV